MDDCVTEGMHLRRLQAKRARYTHLQMKRQRRYFGLHVIKQGGMHS